MSDGRRGPASLVEAGLLALVGAGVLLDTRGYPAPLLDGVPGPAFFPALVAVLLIGGAAVLALRPERGRPGEQTSRGGVLRLVGAALAIAVFLLALPRIGHVVALPPLVGGLMWISGERSPWILAAVPVVFAACVHFLFVVTLGVPLP